MANEFRCRTIKNVNAVAGTGSLLYATPDGKSSIMLELDIANTTSAVVEASVQIFDTSATTSAYIVKNAPVPAGGSLMVIAGQKIVLEPTDIVKVTATGAVDVVAAILEDVNPA